MKRTHKELDNVIDRVTAEIRQETIDEVTVAGAAERVLARLSTARAIAPAETAPVDQIQGCADFQALIPAYLQKSLTEARTLLLEDHTRDCLPCRKALKEARSATSGVTTPLTTTAPAGQMTNPRSKVLRWAVAAAIIVTSGLITMALLSSLPFTGTGPASVQAATGTVYLIKENSNQTVTVGDQLDKGQKIRTAKESSVVVRLADGSLIELSERSELSFTENAQGTSIKLAQGNMIVQAAKQRSKHLYVATDDALISVTGTIFSVNNATKGSRVSVIEGEVKLEQGGKQQVLHAGQQVATHSSLAPLPIKQEIAWSRDAARYIALLNELSELRKDLDNVTRPGLRYSTRILDAMPETTVLYAALPNLGATISESNRLLQERIEQNPTLREWWAQKENPADGEPGLNEVIEKIRQFSEYLGEEIVVSAQLDQKGEPDGPLVIADLRDASGFRLYLEEQLAKYSTQDKKQPKIHIIDDPLAAPVTNQSKSDGLYLWLNHDLLIAAPELRFLQQVAQLLQAQGANKFAQTAFHARLGELYHEGAGLIIAADLERIIGRAVQQNEASPTDRSAAGAKQLGLLNLRQFIAELKENNGHPQNRAVLTFNQADRGLTSWLAAPGPMGALKFISPDANLVAAFVVKEPTALVDDLLGSLQTLDPKFAEHLQKAQTEHNINLRNDLAAPLGGEFAFAIDGPVLPTPSWKVVVEVYDPTRLQYSIQHLVEEINRIAIREGKAGLRLEQTELDGRTFYTIRSVDFKVELNYTFFAGYFIAGPSRGLLDRAIRYYESDHTLLRSPRFIAALPEDKNANFSALFYQNLAPVLAPLARGMSGMMKNLPAEQQEAMKSLNGVAPATLAYAYAQGDRLVFSANSEEGPFGLTPSSLLSLPASFGLTHILQESQRK